jgi:hypothetical protein
MQTTRRSPPPSPGPPPTSKARWNYRRGFGALPIATSAPKQERPRLGEIIVVDGQPWCVYDWIKSSAETTLFVEAI